MAIIPLTKDERGCYIAGYLEGQRELSEFLAQAVQEYEWISIKDRRHLAELIQRTYISRKVRYQNEASAMVF